MRGLSFARCGRRPATTISAYRNRGVARVRASRWRRSLIGRSEEQATPERSNAVSVYYPFALVELLDIGKTDEHDETGEVLIYFRDADGCQVTVRLTEVALEQLRARLARPD
jgi:hypothetical protein